MHLFIFSEKVKFSEIFAKYDQTNEKTRAQGFGNSVLFDSFFYLIIITSLSRYCQIKNIYYKKKGRLFGKNIISIFFAEKIKQSEIKEYE